MGLPDAEGEPLMLTAPTVALPEAVGSGAEPEGLPELLPAGLPLLLLAWEEELLEAPELELWLGQELAVPEPAAEPEACRGEPEGEGDTRALLLSQLLMLRDAEAEKEAQELRECAPELLLLPDRAPEGEKLPEAETAEVPEASRALALPELEAEAAAEAEPGG